MSDYIPPKDSDLLIWSQNLAKFCEDNAVRLKLDGTAVTGYRAKVAAFEQALAKVHSPNHSSVDIAAKNAAKEELVPASRELVQGSLSHNPGLTGEDRAAISIKLPDHARTPAPQPKTRPKAKVIAALKQITITISDEDSPARGKPEKVHGCEIRHGFPAAPPANIEDLTHAAFVTGLTHVFDFEESDRGKHLYFALRWENTRGEKGPWGQIYDMYVP